MCLVVVFFIVWVSNCSLLIVFFVMFTGELGLGGDAPSDLLAHTGNTAISVSFQDWVVQLAHRVLLTRGISVRYYPANVKNLTTFSSLYCLFMCVLFLILISFVGLFILR